jgi:hypothetical protein
MKKYSKVTLIVLVLVLFSTLDADAQCAMCRRIVESNINDGAAAVGKNLNGAILYLMAIPYVILGGLAFMFYRNIRAKMRDEQAV